ncbi:hypothetical protein GCM10007862_12490 [Dyella lipolytica]|nr:hypothetical protein GCM10007862_12490 [Dyella lipolytica]
MVIQMTGGLVIGEAAVDLLLNHEIAVAIGNHACHGDMRAPDIVGTVRVCHLGVEMAQGGHWK